MTGASGLPADEIDTRIVSGIAPVPASPRTITNEFLGLLDDGVRLVVAGKGKRNTRKLVSRYTPKYKVELFTATYYLCTLRRDAMANFRYLVAYVRIGPDDRKMYPRIFYKDTSLVWRSATHYLRSHEENWIGKGELKPIVENGETTLYSAEETTNLPLEIQGALDEVSHKHRKRIERDDDAVGLVLRKAPDHRIEPYADFVTPRRKARANPRNLINNGEYVAYFTRENDPTSLQFVAGFEPDFAGGVIEVTHSASRLYGGKIDKYRILARNRQIQYQFITGPHHVWIIPAQALTSEIMSYGVRTIDVNADENLFVPGYEYHFLDDTEDPPEFHSQIPKGFAGEQSDVEPDRADASPWNEKLPVIAEFRRVVLGGRRRRSSA